MSSAFVHSVNRVRQQLAERAPGLSIVEMPASTRTAREAAATIGCSVDCIAKSLVFLAADQSLILVVASGSKRVSLHALEAILGQSARPAAPALVLENTGFAVGGVSVVGHLCSLRIYLDKSLEALPLLWIAAGSPTHVFSASPDQLRTLTQASFVDVCE